jgi:hypothetical protein
MEYVPSPNGVARHQGDHYFGHRANQPLQIQYIESGHSFIIHIARLPSHALISA